MNSICKLFLVLVAAMLALAFFNGCTNPTEPVVVDCAANRQAALDRAIENSRGESAVGIGYYCPASSSRDALGMVWEYVRISGASAALADIPYRGEESCWNAWACWYWKDHIGIWHMSCGIRRVCQTIGGDE